MRKFAAVAAFLAISIGVSGTAFADDRRGPSGSQAPGQDVQCGHFRTILDSPVVVYNGFAGLEVCHDEIGRVFIESNWHKEESRGPIYLPDYLHVDLDREFLIPGDDIHIELPF